MTSAQIRQSFLDFFASQGHTIVPSSSLLPDSPGLLFTNAGMNQFVPIFLGDRAADVSKWAGVRPSKDTRAADTQKCIRAGGKHNDLEDVGFDTYHHTLFEMLGNWSFGDYFKKESLTWGWHLLTKVWGMPAKRLFATVYAPKPGDPSEFDHEAAAIWTELFKAEGLDPAIHIVHGNRKDNFWMMGDTGPCGPCSEIHFNLLANDDEVEGRKLVNSSSPRCIEIWNHVFIQFNANADGTFSPLAAKHVDTGMGFERVAGIHATTKGFTTFGAEPSNYEADVFAPLFAKVTALSGKTYARTVPTKREGLTEQEHIDIAFRVLADHARTISCAIADGILPGNEGRNYVIRRILRRGILYGTKLGLKAGFFEQLVAPVVESLGPVFPELVAQQDIVRRVIRSEEESFGRTLERGLLEFNSVADEVVSLDRISDQEAKSASPDSTLELSGSVIPGGRAFRLYDTYGFPLDMTQLLAAERGMTVDTVEFEVQMEKQRERGRAAQRREIVVAAKEGEERGAATEHLVYTTKLGDRVEASVVATYQNGDEWFLVLNRTPLYAEMGGQAGDHGFIGFNDRVLRVIDVTKSANGEILHKIDTSSIRTLNAQGMMEHLLGMDVKPGMSCEVWVDCGIRRAISRHHSAAHLIHWALRKVLGNHVRQAGTSKTPDRMRFDFSHFEAMTPEQLREVERLVNEKVIDNARVETYETDFDKKPEGTLAFFGEKYGKVVRVVDIGGYSRELCGGTHVATAGEIGFIKIVAEMAIAAGTRRIEAVAGQAAFDLLTHHDQQLRAVGAKLNAGPTDVVAKLDALLAHKAESDRKLRVFEQKAAAGLADELVTKSTERGGLRFVSAVVTVDSPEALRALGSQVVSKLGEGVVRLGAVLGDKATVVAFCSPAAIKAGHQAGKLVAALCAQIGGKGGGKPDFAMGGGKETARLTEVLAEPVL
ncbi:MAG TPA: alanine--tRNA ligase [Opitutaceae bacterium]|nr:alanine--tRNA ligase [Opitutaceae bacterium]